MAHENWCGKPCGECMNPCRLDESIPCSPDCQNINFDGTRNETDCLASHCDAIDSE